MRAIAVVFATILLAGCSTNQNVATDHNHKMEAAPMLEPGMATPAPGGGTYLQQSLPAEILSLPLVDAGGKGFSLSDFQNQTVVITNFLTSCQEICPMTTVNMRDIAQAVKDAQSSDRVKVLEISVDGERDTPERMAAYQELFHDNSWTLASGSIENLAKLWTYFGAPAKRMEIEASEAANMPTDWQTGKPSAYDMMHSDIAIIIDKGVWRWLTIGTPKISGEMPKALKSFLTEEGLANLAKPEEPTWSVSSVLSALTGLTGTHF